MNRRGFLGAILAAAAGPAIVRAGSLMPIYVPSQKIIGVTSPFEMEIGTWENVRFIESPVLQGALTSDMIRRVVSEVKSKQTMPYSGVYFAHAGWEDHLRRMR